MSVAAMQARKFYEQVVNDGRVFTFSAEGEYLVFPVVEGEAVPFWSSRSRMEAIRERLPKYRAYTIDEMQFEEFAGEVPPLLEQQNVLVGVNWSGPILTGYNMSVVDLRHNLEYWLTR